MALKDTLRLSDSPLRERLAGTIGVIDGLHRVPAIAPLPVLLTRKRSEQGAYRYRTRPIGPVAIEISRIGTHPQLTLIHEVGHLLDQTALNPLKLEFGSSYHSAFNPLLLAWERSRNVKELTRLAGVAKKRMTAGARRYLA